ncbi:ATP-dependent DNA ligase [Anaeromyxobacter sp. Red801]|uniref:ATP-dependent DNA ligase n=1 Tax=Anaeromyxobacter sp. Red801 TaxID=3411632 RepID=UPI003BA1C855
MDCNVDGSAPVAWPPLDLPVVPPFPPMEARLADVLPADEGWQFEPKWDGFRCLLFKQDAEVVLQSKAGQPLGRYFPELVAAGRSLRAPRLVLDGEIVVPSGLGLSFDALLQRIHPAESRVQRLARETPARLVAFDLLVDGDGRRLVEAPLEVRRAALLREAPGFPPELSVSPATLRRADAEAWLATPSGTDGVIAKRLGVPYASGERDAMVKVKRVVTLDAVVGGFRRGQRGGPPASLLLGLHGPDGRLHHVGHVTLAPRQRERFAALLEPLAAPGAPGFTGEAPGGPSRWARGRSTEWIPVRPELVVEVAYRHAAGGRLRHGARLLRVRPDKAPAQCLLRDLPGGEDRLA